MAFPIIPKRRSGATGNPTSLELGELATNTATGELFLGGDGGVMLLNAPTSAGTTVTEHTGDGITVAFTFTGYSTNADGAYIVSVGGIDQPPSKYSVSNTNGGTITFVEAPVAGELISIRAIVAGGGGGGSGDATSLQGRALSDAIPDNKMCIAWNESDNQWQPSFPQEADAVKLQGRNVSGTAPTDSQVLGWDDANSTWKPVDANAGVDASSLQTHAIADDIPEALEILTWAQDAVGGGDYKWRPRPLTGSAVPVDKQALVFDGATWLPADVDAVKLYGQPVSTAVPVTGNLLRFDGSAWTPFNGIAVPNWDSTVNYTVGDYVYHQGRIWYVKTGTSAGTEPNGINSEFVELLGVVNGVPNDPALPIAWRYIQTPDVSGYIPIYQ